jgi:hypothetical protein
MGQMMATVLALDTGFAHTGCVLAEIAGDKPSGFNVLRVTCVHTDEIKKRIGKEHLSSLYKSDIDIERAGYIYTGLKDFLAGTRIDMLVSESPTSGGKSAIAIRSMGIATGALGVIVALMPEAHFINLQPDAIKRRIGGGKTAGKMGVERAVRATFREYAWPTKRRDAEHIFDAAGALLASKDTDVYKMLAKTPGDDRRGTL